MLRKIAVDRTAAVDPSTNIKQLVADPKAIKKLDPRDLRDSLANKASFQKAFAVLEKGGQFDSGFQPGQPYGKGDKVGAWWLINCLTEIKGWARPKARKASKWGYAVSYGLSVTAEKAELRCAFFSLLGDVQADLPGYDQDHIKASVTLPITDETTLGDINAFIKDKADDLAKQVAAKLDKLTEDAVVQAMNKIWDNDSQRKYQFVRAA